jgi:ribosomal protein L14E/L6E/L27E
LMPTSKKVDINKGASEKEVVDALEKLKWCGFDECS